MFRLVEGGEKLPQRATRYSAGFDVFAREDVVIGAGETATIGLGIALDLSGFTPNGCIKCGGSDEVYQDSIAGHYCDECGMQLDNAEALEFFMSRYYLKLCLRSSLGAKGLILPNGHGVIDMDYHDEIKMIIHNPITDMVISYEHQEHELFGATSHGAYRINKGDKIGQLILCRHEGYLLPAEYTLDAERTGGFGSTDK